MKKTVEMVLYPFSRMDHCVDVATPGKTFTKVKDKYLNEDESRPNGTLHIKDFPELSQIKVPTKATITFEVPREKGWYPCRTKRNPDCDRIMYFDGEVYCIARSRKDHSTWDEDELSWIADDPIPDPFEGYHYEF